MKTVQVEVSISSPSLTFGNSIGEVGGITEGISGKRYRCYYRWLKIRESAQRRNQANAMKSCEPETARRRRDSLDQTVLDASAEVVTRPNEPSNGSSELKLGPSRNFGATIEQPSNSTSSDLNIVLVSQVAQPSDAPLQFSTSFLSFASVSNGKNEGLDVGISREDEMEEEAPETSNNTTELSLGSFGGFAINSSPNPSMPKTNPFGGSFNNLATSLSSSTTTNSGAFSGGFNVVAAVPAQAPSGFGQPTQIGSGQQILGSVLDGFGQSRQLGSGFAAPGGFGSGFAGSNSTSGFSNTAIGGGFAKIASTGGGFAGVASTGGFTGAATSLGGFTGAAAPDDGFGGAVATGGGFGGAVTSHFSLIHRWIFVQFEHQVHNPITIILTVENFDIIFELREIPFAL
ncbi:Nuclear pore complex protein NUP214 [Glycine soja]